MPQGLSHLFSNFCRRLRLSFLICSVFALSGTYIPLSERITASPSLTSGDSLSLSNIIRLYSSYITALFSSNRSTVSITFSLFQVWQAQVSYRYIHHMTSVAEYPAPARQFLYIQYMLVKRQKSKSTHNDDNHRNKHISAFSSAFYSCRRSYCPVVDTSLLLKRSSCHFSLLLFCFVLKIIHRE